MFSNKLLVGKGYYWKKCDYFSEVYHNPFANKKVENGGWYKYIDSSNVEIKIINYKRWMW